MDSITLDEFQQLEKLTTLCEYSDNVDFSYENRAGELMYFAINPHEEPCIEIESYDNDTEIVG